MEDGGAGEILRAPGRGTAGKSILLLRNRTADGKDGLRLASADFPVTVQVLNTATAVCFASTFAEADAKRTPADQLKLRR